MSERGPAITVVDVSKRFRLYKDKPTNLKERLVRRGAKRYDDFWALRDINLEVPRGATYGLIGHNGSGKSTLLKLMAGIHRPTTGTVTHDGRITALLELGAGFHPELSGRENVYLNGSILGMTRRQIDAAMDDIRDFSDLGEFFDSPVKVYSSGMYVRLGFAIAVNLDPEILIVDEVLAVGDEEFQRRCFDHIYRLRRQGVTIVFVSHSMPLVQSLCDHAAWLDHGRVMSEGTALDVVDAYLDAVNAQESARLRQRGQQVDDTGRRGSREVTITGVEFLDAAGEPTLTGTTGDPLTIRVHYDAATAVDDAVFGLAVHHESGVHVAGPNTRLAGVNTGRINGQGHIDYHLPRLMLMPGAYLLTAAVFDSGILHPYDFRDRAFQLHVQPGSSSEQYGMVELLGQWRGPDQSSGMEKAG